VLFSSALFLLLALPLVLAGYHLLPHALRNAWLLLASLAFYGWGEPKLLWVMVASMAWNFAAGWAVGAARGTRWDRPLLVTAVSVNLAALAWFKYAGWLAVQAPGVGALALDAVDAQGRILVVPADRIGVAVADPAVADARGVLPLGLGRQAIAAAAHSTEG